MTTPFIQNAFTAGVLAPSFFGRNDLDKYDLGLAQAVNFYVDYRGGIRNRAGTRMMQELAAGRVRFARFRTVSGQADYVLLFTVGKLFITQGGEFVLGGASPLEITTGHTEADLAGLSFAQNFLTLTITTLTLTPHELTFDAETGTWDYGPLEAFSTAGGAYPDGLVATPSATGAAKFVFTVTAVDADGNESLPGRPTLVENSVNYTVTAGSVSFTWNAVAGAKAYRVYRSIIGVTSPMTIAQEVGFIGEVTTTQLTDGNILPDFSRKPPQEFYPFESGALLGLTVTAGGSGYAANTTIILQSVSGGGNGLHAFPVVLGGAVIGVLVYAFGRRYLAGDTFGISGGGGTGATLSNDGVVPSSGNNPAVATYFQQRRVFAGTENLPNGIWGSQPGSFSNFNFRTVPQADDGYSIFMDLPTVSPIRHLRPIRDGLLIFHPEGVDRLKASDGQAVSALDSEIEPQAAFGVSTVPPIFVNNDVLYTTARGTALYALSFTFYTNSYTPQDLSILSSHYLGKGRQPIAMAWQEEPNKLLWILLENGTLLTLTYFRDQEIFAWTEHRTNGRVLDIVLAAEAGADVLYLHVEREVGGVMKYFLEAMQPRELETVEQGWFVDCGLQSTLTYPDAALTFTFGEGTAEATASSAVFGSAAVGDIVRAFDGVFEVTAVTSTTVLQLVVVGEPRENLAAPQESRRAASGLWSIATPFTVFSGLDHLEGKSLSVLADGDAFLDVPVVDGSITLTQPATLVTAGLPYVSSAKTLPLSDPQMQIDSKRKRIVGTAVRLNASRGLAFGTRPNQLYEMKDRTDEDWGQVLDLRNGNIMIQHTAKWQRDAQLLIEQRYPLPAEVLGLAIEAEVGL